MLQKYEHITPLDLSSKFWERPHFPMYQIPLLSKSHTPFMGVTHNNFSPLMSVINPSIRDDVTLIMFLNYTKITSINSIHDDGL